MKNIFAHTDPNRSLPAYVSLNERDGRVVLSVRSDGAQNTSQIELTPDQVHDMACKMTAYWLDRGLTAPKRDHCPERLKPGGCQLHNLHCGFPACNEPPKGTHEI